VNKDLRVGIGASDQADSRAAGVAAATQMVEGLGCPPDAVIVFGSMRFDHRQLLAGIGSVSGDAPLVGGTTAGEISAAGFATASVVIMGLSSSVLRFHSAIGTHMSDDEYACGIHLAQELSHHGDMDDALTLLVFPNGLGGDGVKVIDGLHSVLGKRCEIVGGYLGDDERFASTFQYYDGRVYRDGMPGLLITGPSQFCTGVGVRSGFSSIGNRLYCTKASGNTVQRFDDEPALELYKEFLGQERTQRLPGICLEYPFGLIDDKVSIAGKEYFQLRCGLAVDEEQSSITLAASIPEGSAITLTTASRSDIINGAKMAAEQAKQSLQGAQPHAVLMFSCVGRKLVLGRRTNEEVAAVQEVVGTDVPLIGFYTYGEIGPIDKMQEQLRVTRFHNETVVVWVLGAV